MIDANEYEGIMRGLNDLREGKVRPFSEIVRELDEKGIGKFPHARKCPTCGSTRIHGCTGKKSK